MYLIQKRLEISGAHSLTLDYESKCKNLHGHNWQIEIFCASGSLNKNGMVIDFTEIKRMISDKLDHKNLNDVFSFNPTAENIARWICDEIPQAYMVEVQESEGNIAVYRNDFMCEKYSL